MFRINRKTISVVFMTMGIVFVVAACSMEPNKPSVVITSPPSGSQFSDGEQVAIQSTATDAKGVVRVELIVDNVVVRTDPAPAPQGQPSLTLIQNWQATAGTHTIIVRAYNAAGAMSEPVAVALIVSGQTTQLKPTTVVSASSASSIAASPTSSSSASSSVGSSASTISSSSSSAAACTNNSAYVADVTVPDGTVLAPGQTFNKIWRLNNTGTCVWGSGYQLVFVSGEAMTISTTVAVPATAPGSTVDILVPMTASSAGGNHSGQWKMRAANGTLFGQGVTVKINVLSASSVSSSASSVSGCTGTPTIVSFTASTASIPAATTITVAPGTAVTLSWGQVLGADSAEIDQGIEGIETPGSRTINPTTTTTWTLTAHCGSTTKTAQVKVNIVVLPPPVAVIYDFIAKANVSADNWQSSGGSGSFNLPFPGIDTDTKGFALWRDNYKLNDGSQPTRVLETHPQWTASGTISRCYHDLWTSGYQVQPSDYISGKVGFLQGASAGNVTFRVRLRTDSFPNNDVSVIPLVYADGVKSFNVALGTINSGQYVGHQADVCLIVEAGTSAGQDWAVWQDVRIIR